MSILADCRFADKIVAWRLNDETSVSEAVTLACHKKTLDDSVHRNIPFSA